MSIRVIPAAVLVATLLAVGILGGQPHPAAAAAGDAESGATTYQLDPANGRLNVTVTVKVKNSIPNTSESYSCVQYRYDPSYGYLPYAGTCSRTTRYYLDSTSLWIENEATGIKASSGGTTLSAKAGQKAGAWHLVTVGFPKLWNGQSRTVKVTYVLKSAAPRSGSTIRLMQAYASFCVLAAAGVDPGSITVRVPAGFTFTTSGTPLSAKVIGSERVYSGSVADPSSYWTCFEGTNEAGFRSDQVAGPGGRQVQVKSWPEDTAWATAVEADVAKGLPALTRLVGVEPPGTAPLVVKESVTGSDYAGFYEMGTNTITVGEDFDQPSLVEHELAHVWFNNSLFDGTWLSEGSAGWAGRATSGDEAPCSRPATGAAGINLNAWAYLTPRSTDADRATVAAEYDAACYIVTKVAGAAGAPGMTAAMTALLSGRDPYSLSAGARPASRLVGWRDWLDAVDELALAPVGARPNLASDLLLEFGVTGDRATIDERTAARTAYLALKASVGDWVVPEAIRRPLSKWDFSTAKAAIEAAGPAWALTGQTDQVLAGLDARRGPAATAWAAATTTADLTAAGNLAQAQHDAAVDVAAAMTLAAAPLDLVQQIGLIGSTIPPVDPAIGAVRDGRMADAAGVTSGVRTAIGALKDAGQLRIGIAAAVSAGLLLLLTVLVLVRIRSRRRRTVRALAVADSAAGTSEPMGGPDAPTVAWSGVADDAAAGTPLRDGRPGHGDDAPTEVVPAVRPPTDAGPGAS